MGSNLFISIKAFPMINRNLMIPSLLDLKTINMNESIIRTINLKNEINYIFRYYFDITGDCVNINPIEGTIDSFESLTIELTITPIKQMTYETIITLNVDQ